MTQDSSEEEEESEEAAEKMEIESGGKRGETKGNHAGRPAGYKPRESGSSETGKCGTGLGYSG